MKSLPHLALAVAILPATWGAVVAAPAAPRPGDTALEYSHSMPVTVSGKDAVVQLRLPQAAYLHSRSATLDDIRIFDTQGKSLPFALLEPVAAEESTRRHFAAKVFPVYGLSDKGGELKTDIDYRTAPDGSLLSISTRATRREGATLPALRALVLDMSQSKHSVRLPIDSLTFRLPDRMKNYSARVLVEASDDLNTWDTIATASLNWLVNQQADALTNDVVRFEPRAFRYARLSWQEGEPVPFLGIMAGSPMTTRVKVPADSAILTPAPGKQPGDLVYQAPIAVPVRSVGLVIAEQNVVLPSTLGQYREVVTPRGSAPTRWDFDPAVRATFFRLNQGGQERSSGEVAVDGVHASQWVLRSPAAVGSQPGLRLGWTPATLVIMTNGKMPYTLSVGNGKAGPARRPLSEVAPGFSDAELARLEQASVGGAQARPGSGSGVEASAAEQAKQAFNSRTAVLWGVLLLGVAALGAMTWRLLRQMGKPAE